MATTPGPQSDDEALELMKKHGIINKDMTWEKIAQIAESEGLATRGGGTSAMKWSFWVKGKFIHRDDA
jgi:hypothetical protein